MARDLSAAMTGLVRGVTRVRVIDAGVSGAQALAGPVLCELDGEDAAGVLARLAVETPPTSSHCMCLGHPAIELWAGAERRATIGVHHGRSVRVHGWWSDAPLRDGEALLRWLADRGATEPLATLVAEKAAASAGERRRLAWLAAAPAVLRPRLAALEGEGMMLPRFLRATDADVVAAVEEVRAAYGEAAAAVLLGWYGGPGGPWSGYPGYEQVAEVLLRRVPFEVLIVAGGEADEGVLLGLARFLARHERAPRERRAVRMDLRARLVELVDRRGDADMRARLAAALQEPPPRTREGVKIGDADLGTTLGRPVAIGDGWATIDGASVTRYRRGATRRAGGVVLPEDEVAELAAVGAELVVTLSPRGEVWRVGEGPARVIAGAQARPLAPAGLAGRAAWIEQVSLKGHRTATRVRVEGEERAVAEHAGNAWDLLACDEALWWARHGGSLWSTLFGKNIHRADLMRWDPRTAKVQVMRVLEGGGDEVSVPRLFTDGRRIAWTSGRRIGVIAGAGEPRWFEVDAEILAVHPHRDGVLVAVARQEVGELLWLENGARRSLARWGRAPWEREQLAVSGGQAVWNAGESLWAVALP